MYPHTISLITALVLSPATLWDDYHGWTPLREASAYCELFNMLTSEDHWNGQFYVDFPSLSSHLSRLGIG